MATARISTPQRLSAQLRAVLTLIERDFGGVVAEPEEAEMYSIAADLSRRLSDSLLNDAPTGTAGDNAQADCDRLGALIVAVMDLNTKIAGIDSAPDENEAAEEARRDAINRLHWLQTLCRDLADDLHRQVESLPAAALAA